MPIYLEDIPPTLYHNTNFFISSFCINYFWSRYSPQYYTHTRQEVTVMEYWLWNFEMEITILFFPKSCLNFLRGETNKTPQKISGRIHTNLYNHTP